MAGERAERANHLAAVPDDPDASDAFDPLHTEITDTDITFVGALGPLKIDGRTSALIVQLIIDPQTPISHRDFALLRHRHLEVRVSPVARRGGEVVPADPRVDPVAEQVEARRVERLVKSWVSNDAKTRPPDPDPDDLS